MTYFDEEQFPVDPILDFHAYDVTSLSGCLR